MPDLLQLLFMQIFILEKNKCGLWESGGWFGLVAVQVNGGNATFMHISTDNFGWPVWGS